MVRRRLAALKSTSGRQPSRHEPGTFAQFAAGLRRRLEGDLMGQIATAPLDEEASVDLLTVAGTVRLGWSVDDVDEVIAHVHGPAVVRDLCHELFES